jgi:hypothetical protein
MGESPRVGSKCILMMDSSRAMEDSFLRGSDSSHSAATSAKRSLAREIPFTELAARPAAISQVRGVN